MPSKEQKKKRIWLRVLVGALIFLAAMVLAIVVAVNFMLNRINRPDLSQTYITPSELEEIDLREAVEENERLEKAGGAPAVVYPELDDSEIQWGSSNRKVLASPKLVNVLLIGQDRRPGEGRARSDSMILVTFNKSAGTIVMTSFLRDLYVQIPGYENNRLNAAYAFGGMELLDETLEDNFGVKVDYNVEVDFSEFSEIIDILGGVDIELTYAEADYLGLSPGMHHMDGDTALAYSRIRYIDSDFSRTNRQRKVLLSLYDSMKNVSAGTALDIVNKIFPLLTTDMSNLEIISLATDLFPMLSGSTVESHHIPAEGTWNYNTVRGMSVIIPDYDANRDYLAGILTPEQDS